MSEYTAQEERLNVLTHGFGVVLSIIALILMLIKSFQANESLSIISSLFFGISLILLYSASTLYHSATNPVSRIRLKIFDHAAIFLLIAGTYTPYCLVTLKGDTGWLIFGVVWSIAILGVIFKLFYTGKYERLSTIMYLGMGWVIVFAAKPLMDNLPSLGLYWLVAGGLSYTIGAIFYSINRIPFNHAIFHVFVLIGSFSHFYSIYNYVL